MVAKLETQTTYGPNRPFVANERVINGVGVFRPNETQKHDIAASNDAVLFYGDRLDDSTILFLHTVNEADRAVCALQITGKNIGIPPIHATIDGEPLELTIGQRVDVPKDHTLEVWLGPPVYDKSDPKKLGYAKVEWTEPGALPT